MAKSQEEKIYDAKVNAKGTSAHYAAQEYVWKGLEKTGLDPATQNKLAKDLIPIVKARIQEDNNKTAMRAKMIESSQKRNKIKNAKEEIVGGGKTKPKGN